jgi:hypothetical protein
MPGIMNHEELIELAQRVIARLWASMDEMGWQR